MRDVIASYRSVLILPSILVSGLILVAGCQSGGGRPALSSTNMAPISVVAANESFSDSNSDSPVVQVAFDEPVVTQAEPFDGSESTHRTASQDSQRGESETVRFPELLSAQVDETARLKREFLT